MKNLTLKISGVLILTFNLFFVINAQIGINDSGSNPHSSAILDINSNNKGLLVPRMNQIEIELISNPANGLIVFNTTNNKFYAYIQSSNEWKEINYGEGTIPGPWDGSCGDSITYGGETYGSLQIGSQCWMSKNLNIGIRININQNQTDNNIIEKYCYDDDTLNCITYGGLYQWPELMQYVEITGSQGLCPVGWHIPTDEEYKTLEIYFGMSQTQADSEGWRGNNEGSKLAGTETLWIDGELDSDIDFGISELNLLPGGADAPSGVGSVHITGRSFHWTSNSVVNAAYYRSVEWPSTNILREPIGKDWGISVRCIKD